MRNESILIGKTLINLNFGSTLSEWPRDFKDFKKHYNYLREVAKFIYLFIFFQIFLNEQVQIQWFKVPFS